MSETNTDDEPLLDINGNPLPARPLYDALPASADEPAPEPVPAKPTRSPQPPGAAMRAPKPPPSSPPIPGGAPFREPAGQRFDLAGNPLPPLPPAPPAAEPPPAPGTSPFAAARAAQAAAQKRRKWRDGMILTTLALSAGLILYLFLFPQTITKLVRLLPTGSKPPAAQPSAAPASIAPLTGQRAAASRPKTRAKHHKS